MKFLQALAVIAILLGGLWLIGNAFDRSQKEGIDCKALGGDYVHPQGATFCVKDGLIVKIYRK